MRKYIAGLLSLAMVFTSFFMFLPKTNALSVTTVDLLAGQDIDVGEIKVWNDAENLYVKYILDVPGWEMTESHLYIGNIANIPKTKTGNPIPGKFTYNTYHNPAVTTYTYTLDRDEITTASITIAAHAAIVHKSLVNGPVVEYVPTVTWTRSTENLVINRPGYGGAWTYGGIIGLFTDMSEVVWDNGANNSQRPLVPGVEYASWEYFANNGGSYNGTSDIRLFRATFNIPNNFVVTNAKLGVVNYADRIPINDNVYVYANQDLIFWGGTRAGTIGTHEGMAGLTAIGYNSGAQLETDGWYIPGTFPTITNLTSGANKIEVFTEENERWGGMGKLVLTTNGYYQTYQVDQSESAWGAGNRITPKGNWGTYFNYTFSQGWQLVDTVTVPSNGNNVNSINLINGENYKLITSGTYRFANWGDAGIADAKFSLRTATYVPGGFGYETGTQWVNGAHLGMPYYLQVWINNNPAMWEGDYNEDHEYTKLMTGTGSNLVFDIKDNVYNDNSGNITVKIYQEL